MLAVFIYLGFNIKSVQCTHYHGHIVPVRARVLEVGDPVILHEGPLAALVEQGEQVCTELLNNQVLRIL